jgi:hypothetical protein
MVVVGRGAFPVLAEFEAGGNPGRKEGLRAWGGISSPCLGFGFSSLPALEAGQEDCRGCPMSLFSWQQVAESNPAGRFFMGLCKSKHGRSSGLWESTSDCLVTASQAGLASIKVLRNHFC